MTKTQRIEMIKNAIRNTQIKVNRAIEAGQLISYEALMYDLGALQACLYSEIDRNTTEGDAEYLLDEMKAVEARLEHVKSGLVKILRDIKLAV